MAAGTIFGCLGKPLPGSWKSYPAAGKFQWELYSSETGILQESHVLRKRSFPITCFFETATPFLLSCFRWGRPRSMEIAAPVVPSDQAKSLSGKRRYLAAAVNCVTPPAAWNRFQLQATPTPCSQCRLLGHSTFTSTSTTQKV